MNEAGMPKWAAETPSSNGETSTEPKGSEGRDRIETGAVSAPVTPGPISSGPIAEPVLHQPSTATTTSTVSTTRARSMAPVILAALLAAVLTGVAMFFVMRSDGSNSASVASSSGGSGTDVAGPSTTSPLSIEVDRQPETEGAEIATATDREPETSGTASPSESNQSGSEATITAATQPPDESTTAPSPDPSEAATCKLNLLAQQVDQASLVCASGTIEISGSTERWHNDVAFLVLEEGVDGQLDFEPQSNITPPPLLVVAGENTPDADATRHGTSLLTLNFTEADQHVYLYSEPNGGGRKLTLHYRP